MYLNLSQFKKITTQIKTLTNCVVDGVITLERGFDSRTRTHNTVSVKFANLKFKNLNNLYQVVKQQVVDLIPDLVASLSPINRLKLSDKSKVASCILINTKDLIGMKSLKFVPKKVASFKVTHENMRNNLDEYGLGFFSYARNASLAKSPPRKGAEDTAITLSSDDFVNPLALVNDPIEYVEGGNTYRIVTVTNHWNYRSDTGSIVVMARDDDKLFNYLDKGFFILRIKEQLKNKVITRYVVTNELDINTMHIFTLCNIQPKLTELLRDGCFVHSTEAGVTRLKLEKKLNDNYRSRYDTCRALIDEDYQSNTSIMAVNSLFNGTSTKVNINDITLTLNSATYQNICIEAPELLQVLNSRVNFGGEFDIYSLINSYATYIQLKLDVGAVAEENKEEVLESIKINNISIGASLTSFGVRKINNLRINKVEVAEVIHRASCYHDQKDYDLFVKRVSKMSLRWHDVLANGLAVKIHNTMNHADLQNPKPGADAPSINVCFSPEHKKLALNIDGKHIPVRLARLIEKVDTINRKTNGRWTTGYLSSARDHAWAQRQLVEALIECTTFEKKTQTEEGVTKIDKIVGVTRKDVEKLLAKANEVKLKAIQKSKQFMETAIRLTNAERIEFLGKAALKVEGSLRTYAVIIETAKVYDFDSKKYRCIVNDRHYQGAGYDDIASRLYALKNDSVMQKHIGTLKGDAQPNAENAHNNELPDRNESINIPDDVLDQLVEA